MNKHSPSASGSLLERAAELYDFGAACARRGARAAAEPVPEPAPAARPSRRRRRAPSRSRPTPRPSRCRAPSCRRAARRAPTGAAGRPRRARRGAASSSRTRRSTGLAEEFRIVKRQLLLGIGAAGQLAEEQAPHGPGLLGPARRGQDLLRGQPGAVAGRRDATSRCCSSTAISPSPRCSRSSASRRGPGLSTRSPIPRSTPNGSSSAPTCRPLGPAGRALREQRAGAARLGPHRARCWRG